jgi:hypothetical protein
MSALTERVLAKLQQSEKSWQPRALALLVGEKADTTSYALRELYKAHLIDRTPLPGHNQFAYQRLGAKAVAPPETPRAPRVVWSHAERQQMLIETHRLLQAKRGFSFRDALFEAQAILPDQRRHGQLSSNSVRLMRELYEKMPLPETPVEAPAPLAEAALDDDAEGVAEAPTVMDRPDPLGDMLHRLIDAITTQIAEQLLDTLTTRINQSLARLSLPAAAPPMPIVKMRFVVAGLKGQQKTEIQAALPKTAQVTFWSVDESPHHLKALCRDADQIFLMTKFVSHSHENMVRSVAADRLVRVNGGVTTLSEQLRKACR